MKPYYEIGRKSTIKDQVFDFAISPSEWLPYYNFDAKQLPHELIYQDEFFRWLSQRYSFIAGVLRLDPYTCYNWHTDTRRGVGINMLLTPNTRSFCTFALDADQLVFKIEELKYKPNTYYLFNTQVPHTVYNFETTRYLMSVEFAKDRDELSFNDLLKDIQTNYE
ncbi:hypothetical protein EB001_08630 [bacterium]|nr:hypothetical protein [bacterium]